MQKKMLERSLQHFEFSLLFGILISLASIHFERSQTLGHNEFLLYLPVSFSSPLEYKPNRAKKTLLP
jgi:hypothetical protein